MAGLAADGEHAFQVNTLDSYDEDLVRSLLAFAREHTAEILADPRPLIPLSGFAAAGRDFDTAVAAAPRAHAYHLRENPDLHRATYAVFPGWHYEFSGTETDQEAQFQVSHPQGLLVTRLDRTPVPFLKMRYDNTRTRAGSVGPDRGIAKRDELLRELELFVGAGGSFVEFENHRHQLWCARFADGRLSLTGADGR